MNKWINYGKWRHPQIWWNQKLKEYMGLTDPDKLRFNPTVISVDERYIYFGMYKHMGQLRISKDRILKTIECKN